MKTINEYLDALKKPVEFKNRNVAEIWDAIIEKKSAQEMGFDNEEELKSWIADNPYENI